MPTCHPTELARLLQQATAEAPLDLIDVRTPVEYRGVHVRGARLMPLDQLASQAVRFSRPAGAQGPVYVLCKSGGRARKACEKLTAAGLEAVLVTGGTDACVAAGLPVVRGQAGMSLERQVRIAAGLLVALGTLGGVFLHPWVLALPLAVGCGLVFAGVTDFCGMALLLARMPWNRTGGSAHCNSPACT